MGAALPGHHRKPVVTGAGQGKQRGIVGAGLGYGGCGGGEGPG